MRPVVFANAAVGGVERHQASVLEDRDPVQEPLGHVEIVRHHDDDAALRTQAAEPLHQSRHRRVVEASERLVEQQQPRLVQQRPLEREPLAHAPRETRDQIVGTGGQPGPLQRIGHARRDAGDAVEAGEELEVLSRGQLGIEMQVVGQESEAGPQVGACLSRRHRPVAHLS